MIDDQTWAIIEGLLPLKEAKRGGQYHDHRRVGKGIASKFPRWLG